MSELQTLGQLIKRLRMSAGFSQRELAQQLEIDATYLSHLEADRREPSLQLLRRIASALKSPPGLLLALALWTDLPTDEKESYRPLVESLLRIATASHQFKLPING